MEVLKKGQKVAVVTIDGVVEKLVWEDLGWAVQVCSDAQYEAIEKGKDAPQLIGFRRKYVDPVMVG